MTSKRNGGGRKEKGRGKKKEKSQRTQKEREKLVEKKESLTRSEEDLDEKEKKASMDIEVADGLLNEASSKLDDALSSTPLNKTSGTVSKMMLDSAKEKHQKAVDSLDNIWKQKKPLDETKHKLLGKALSSTEFGQKKWKSNDEEASAKKLKPSVGKSQDKN